MFGRVIGALVGRELDRRDGRGGLKGAAMGALAIGAMRRMGPLGMVLGGAYVAKKAMDRRRDMRGA
jgi:ribulose 1,5-bisphosphate synthetase/thiazole synthase